MKLRTVLACLVLAWLVAGPTPALAAESVSRGYIDPAEVVETGLPLDGVSITVRGEAIGEDLRADADHRWVNILGGGTAIGVYMDNETAELIERYGDYRGFGDLVEVQGVVNVACDQHGGEYDIHAESLTVVEPGGDTEHPVHPWKAIVGAAGLALAFVEYRVYRYRKEKRPQ